MKDKLLGQGGLAAADEVMQSQQRTLTCEHVCVYVCVCDHECDSICSCDSAAKSRITHTEDFTVKLPYFIYDLYDFFLYFSTHSSTFQWKFSQDTYELSPISGWCLGKIGFNIPDALGEVFPGQSALVAVHVKFAGTLLHGMDADAYGDL